MRFLVAPGRSDAFPTIIAALTHPAPEGESRIVDVAPGIHRTDGLTIWGPGVVIRAAQGAGSVVINCSADFMFKCQKDVTLEGLVLRGWGKESLMQVSSGQLRVVGCDVQASGVCAVEAWGGSHVMIHGSTVRQGSLAFSDCTFDIADTVVFDSPGNSIGLVNAAQGTAERITVSKCHGNNAVFTSSGSSILLSGCILSDSPDVRSLVGVDHAEVRLRDTRLEKSSGGIVATSGKVTLEDCVISGCDSGLTLVDESILDTIGTTYVTGADFAIITDQSSVLSEQGLMLGESTLADRAHFRQCNNDTFELTWCDPVSRHAHGGRYKLDDEGHATDYQEIFFPLSPEEQQERLDTLLNELDTMVGLTEAKEQVRGIINIVQLSKLRVEQGLPPISGVRNLVFLGPPGTGKTTVARLYGQLLTILNVLSSGQVIEVSRQDLVGQYLGETTQKTAAKIKEAMGGLLFIDEAYSLSRKYGAGKDFGLEAIDTLVKEMEDHRDDLVVIVAGYDREMKDFLESNSGLASRFGAQIHFAPYTISELALILSQFARSEDFIIRDESMTEIEKVFAVNRDRFTQGNAREVRKLFDSMKQAQATRILASMTPGQPPVRADLMELLPEDMKGWLQSMADGSGEVSNDRTA